MRPETVIRFEDVSKGYMMYSQFTAGLKGIILKLPSFLKSLRAHRYEVLKDVSFEIRKGENVGIVGRNGCGKSTTLGLIAGVLKPTRGSVKITGRVSPLLELGGGFHPELPGRDNILLNGVLLGLTRAEVMERMEDIIEFSGLGEFVDQPIRMYSSGMLARLGFSVIAHLDPEVLLIDEVLSVGDTSFQRKCIEKMMQFRDSDVTVVLVSHSASDIKAVCDRVIWIDEHKVRMVGAADEVLYAYESVMEAEEAEEEEAKALLKKKDKTAGTPEEKIKTKQ